MFDEWANKVENLIESREALNVIFDDEEVFYSGDLTEATYSMSFELLDCQDELLDKAMSNFPVWKVFSDLFKIKPREMDVTQLKHEKYLADDYPDVVKTRSGEFMGDPISFIHLTLVWLSLVNQTSAEMAGLSPSRDAYRSRYAYRPFGQQVGDDIVILRVQKKFVDILQRRTDGLGLKRSKIDSISRDTATFCEQYLWKPPKDFNSEGMSPDTLFGDLMFLDTIKGSIMTGRSKVKSDGGTPFLGHASMLAKQIAYTPKELAWKDDRAKTILWARNYREARGLTKSLPAWPRSMGGLGLAVGKTPDLDDPRMERYLPYLYRLFDNNTSQGVILDTLLQLGSIWRGSNKGFIWDSDKIDVMSIAEQLRVVSDEEALAGMPDWLRNKGHSAISAYLSQKGIISLMNLGEELNRRYNFLMWWKGEIPTPRMVRLRTKEAAVKHREVWSHIRSSLEPMGRPFYIRTVRDLDRSLTMFVFGKYFERDDPAIRMAFEGMPSLFYSF